MARSNYLIADPAVDLRFERPRQILEQEQMGWPHDRRGEKAQP